MTLLCSICNSPLSEIEDGFLCSNPSCQTKYHKNEIIKQEEDFSSSHEDEFPELGGDNISGAPLLDTLSDEQDPSLIEQLYKNGKTKPNEGSGAERWD